MSTILLNTGSSKIIITLFIVLMNTSSSIIGYTTRKVGGRAHTQKLARDTLLSIIIVQPKTGATSD